MPSVHLIGGQVRRMKMALGVVTTEFSQRISNGLRLDAL
jgi:hypothetical protein